MADLKHQISINAAPEKVYAAIATQAGLRSWWSRMRLCRSSSTG
jgi:uncharacterized protein YndB with AHSA1/START domain